MLNENKDSTVELAGIQNLIALLRELFYLMFAKLSISFSRE